jgi:AcrR family transcriptional regulator
MRVRTAARREAILDSAALVFLDKGYERASMAEIAASVGGSKATLYGYFPSKDDLFMHVVLHKVGSQLAPAFTNMPDQAQDDPRAVLSALGERFLMTILTPEAIALKRVILAHMTESKLAEQLWALGPQQMLSAVESYLEKATAAGRLQVRTPRIAAKQLLALFEAESVWGGPMAQPSQPLTRDDITPVVSRAVEMFLSACGQKQGGR